MSFRFISVRIIVAVICIGTCWSCLAQDLIASRTNSTPDSISQSENLDIAIQRINRLEQKLDDQQFKAFDERLSDLYKVFTVMGGLLVILAVWGFIRDFHQRKDYKQEREFYQQRALSFEGRQEKSLTHTLKVSNESMQRESAFSKQQLELGDSVLKRSDEMLGRQIDNLNKIGGVFDLVTKLFDAQKKAQDEQMKAANEGIKTNETVENLLGGMRKSYEQSANSLLSLKNVHMMQWPNLLEEQRNRARLARASLSVSIPFVQANEEKNNASNFARTLHLMGITSIYDNEIESALDLLKKADDLYTKIGKEADPKPHAYTKHFLAICEKNWCVPGSDGLNLQTAEELLTKAAEMVAFDREDFLIPVTLAEVQSYRPGSQSDALARLTTLLERFEEVSADKKSKNEELDTTQKSLRVRAHLFSGNLHFYNGNILEAERSYRNAISCGPENSFAYLSLALLHEDGGSNNEINWTNGFTFLEKSGALHKRELSSKVTALAFAILAAKKLNIEGKRANYTEDFLRIEAGIDLGAIRIPLFFSPVSKRLVKFKDLKDQLL